MRSPELPLPTLVAIARVGLVQGTIEDVEPFLCSRNSQDAPDHNRTHSVDDPLNALTGSGGDNLVSPHIERVEPLLCSRNSQPQEHTVRAHPLTNPIPTLTGTGTPILLNVVDNVEPFMSVNYGEREGQAPRSYPVSQPLNGVMPSKGAGVLIRAGADPLNTIRPFIIVHYPDGQSMGYEVDILFRMLSVPELSSAMGFQRKDRTYTFAGTKTDQIRQIGNAVEATLAEKLAYQQLCVIQKYTLSSAEAEAA